jgi:subtilisin family serine protease
MADAPVRVAIVDSGAIAPHPHLPHLAGGVRIDLTGALHDDFADRLGHGTAVAAAIHEKAPRAELYAVKVFDDQLATSVKTLVRAIDWATDHGMQLVNLSLGTPNDFRADELAPAVERAVAAGTIVVAAAESEGQPMYPGCIDGVVGVLLDWDQPRESVRVEGGRVLASGYPRPIPGVPKERNLNGISFAVANATGVLAAMLAGAPPVGTAREAVTRLRRVGTEGASD